MSFLGRLAAPLVRACCAPRAAAFQRALEDVPTAQRRTLDAIVGASAATDYGRLHGVAPGQGIDEFRGRVPVAEYSSLAPWIERQRDERRPLITPGAIRCHEPTSGSGGPVKHIPYNDALLRSFRGMFSIWAHDLLEHRLRPRSGRTFMSVSPASGNAEGFSDDREYLGGALRALVGRFLVMPHGLKNRDDADGFRDALACALLTCGDLEIVSIWNPGYLLVLMEHVEAHRERLLPLLPRKRRAVLEHASVSWPAVWPQLQLISCWTAASAAAPARRLADFFPGVAMQAKGLLATEAPLTVPLVPAGGALPLVDEVFLELEAGDGSLRLLHEAQADCEYALIVTQAGGLLRYRLGDRVRIGGNYRGCPMLEFVGRADAVADLVGEKLEESFVAQVLQRVAAAGAFCTLLPVLPPAGQPYYCLLTDDPGEALPASLEAALSGSYRYREARLLGQLGAASVLARADMRCAVQDAMSAFGIRPGDIKDRVLLTRPDLALHVHRRIAAAQRVPA